MVAPSAEKGDSTGVAEYRNKQLTLDRIQGPRDRIGTGFAGVGFCVLSRTWSRTDIYKYFKKQPKVWTVPLISRYRSRASRGDSCGTVLPGYNVFWICISIETHEIYAYLRCPCFCRVVSTCLPEFPSYRKNSAVWGLREPVFLAPHLTLVVPTHRWRIRVRAAWMNQLVANS